MDWLLGGKNETGDYQRIADIEKLREICFKFESDFASQKLQIKSLQQIIAELSASEETLKSQNSTLTSELTETRRALVESMKDMEEWKQRAFTAVSNPINHKPSVGALTADN